MLKYKPVELNRHENDFLICEDCQAIVLADPIKPRGKERPIGNQRHTLWHAELRIRTS